MFCPYCGKEIDDNAKMCPYCSSEIGQGPEAYSGKGGSGGANKKIMALIPIAALTACFAIGLVAYLIISEKSEPQSWDNPGQSAATEEAAESPEVQEEPVQEESQSAEEQAEAREETEAAEESGSEQTEEVNRIVPSLKPDKFFYYNGHTYGLYNANDHDLYSYYKCADFCRQQGGHLATINDADENMFLYDIISSEYKITAFFGYSDEEEEGVWKWSDGSSDYENWTTYGDWNLPDNGEEWDGDEDYAEFNYDSEKDWIPNDGTWNDAPFMDNTSLFICEWDYETE